jgi:hypothetical protein
MTIKHGRRTSLTARSRLQRGSARGSSQASRVTLKVLPAPPSASHWPSSSRTSSSSRLATSALRDGFLTFLTGSPRAVFAKGSTCNTAFLTGSALQTEFSVTHSKQRIERILTGARMHIKVFEILQISAQNLAALSPQSHPRFVNFRAFLPGTAQRVECDVTHSKQTTDKFLPGATT